MTGPPHRARRAVDRDRGSMTTEFVVLAPIVIVTADVLTVIPFAGFHIQEQATVPLEIFVGTP